MPAEARRCSSQHLLLLELSVLADVTDGRDHEVAGRVRELVQQRDAHAPAGDDQRSSSSPRGAQKTQPESSSADLMYSRRHGAHSCFTQRESRAARSARPAPLQARSRTRIVESHINAATMRQNHEQRRGEEDRLETEHVV